MVGKGSSPAPSWNWGPHRSIRGQGLIPQPGGPEGLVGERDPGLEDQGQWRGRSPWASWTSQTGTTAARGGCGRRRCPPAPPCGVALALTGPQAAGRAPPCLRLATGYLCPTGLHPRGPQGPAPRPRKAPAGVRPLLPRGPPCPSQDPPGVLVLLALPPCQPWEPRSGRASGGGWHLRTWTAGGRDCSSRRACRERSAAPARSWAAPRGTGPCSAAAAAAAATSGSCSPPTLCPPVTRRPVGPGTPVRPQGTPELAAPRQALLPRWRCSACWAPGRASQLPLRTSPSRGREL